jgi:hypothetical protein
MGDALVFFTSILSDKKEAVNQALAATVLDRASIQDRVVLAGIAQRVFG